MQNDHTMPPVWEDPESVGAPVDLLAVLSGSLERWPFVLGMAAAGFFLAWGLSYLLTPRFASKAVFLPPQQRTSPMDNPLSLLWKAPSSAIYTGLLLSDSVVGDVVDKAHFQERSRSKNKEDARTLLRKKTAVSTDLSGFVTLVVTDKDRNLAFELANDYLAALSRLNDRMAIDDASQQRRIFQGELEREKNELENAEVLLKNAQEASGVLLPESQTQAGLSAIDAAKAEIRAQQVRLTVLRQSETEQAPEVVRLRSQIGELEGQLHRLQSSAGGAAGGALAASKAPSVNLEFVRLEREVKYHQTLFDIMSRQYETARMAEASAAPGVQIVDYPEIAYSKAWPRRSLFALVGGVLGLLGAIFYLLVTTFLRRPMQNPRKAAAFLRLRHAITRPRRWL